jgi:alkanesulfonate monooxygenase SsuD/methylene tetrahydromethanopterin reductase-like flavin-dependent oxidoreductase (luciferase family)
MRVGMTLPVMEPDLWDRGAATLEEWARAVDEGPFASLCFGERIAFNNPDALTLLGAVAAWTKRARLVLTVVVPQLHETPLLAKALSTADQLSAGRLTVGVGVGGREQDYMAAGASLSTQTIRGLRERVLAMREVWAGRSLVEGVPPIGPSPLQPGGPPVLVGTMGPKTLRDAAGWADGLAGVTLDLDAGAAADLFALARTSWADAGRPSPLLTTSFWFALDDGDGTARTQVHRHLRHYMDWLPPSLVDAMAPTTGFAGTRAELRDVLRRFEDAGADEVHLIPTGSDVRQVHEVAELLA